MFNDDESTQALLAQWHTMTVDEKKSVKQTVDKKREEVKSYWKGKPLNEEQQQYLDVINGSPHLRADTPKGKLHLERENLTDEMYALEYEMLRTLLTPAAQAWDYAGIYLADALCDPLVQANPVTIALLKETLRQVVMSGPFTKKDELFGDWMKKGADLAASKKGKDAVNAKIKKNAEAKAWVITEWEKVVDKRNVKKSFSRQHALLLKTKFPDVSIGADTIERSWLPKEPT